MAYFLASNLWNMIPFRINLCSKRILKFGNYSRCYIELKHKKINIYLKLFIFVTKFDD